jgi:PAS domain S-box-containing protein
MEPAEGSFYRLIVAQVPVGIIFADPEEIIELWNAECETIFGYGTEEAIGQSLDLIIPERFREAHWKGYWRAMDAGHTRFRGQVLITRSKRKDGKTTYLELAFAIVKGGTGQVIGALATARDVTERYTQEKALRERITELEHQGKTL